MIVVDTNVIAYLLLPGNHTTAAEKLLRNDPDWVAPLLWRSEFRNVLTVYLRRDMLSLSETLVMMEQAERLMKGGEFTVNSARVLNLAASSNCSAYDCEFVSLAQELGTSLITSDRKLLAAFPDVCRALATFSH